MQVSGGFLGCSPRTKVVLRPGNQCCGPGTTQPVGLGKAAGSKSEALPSAQGRQGVSCVPCVNLAFFISKRAGQEGHVSSVDKKESHGRGRRRPWGGWFGGSQAGKLCGGDFCCQMGND